MAVLMTQTMPTGASIQMLDAVTEEMGVDADPPAGMLSHVHYEDGGAIKIIDVWESQQAWETFRDERLNPAMGKVAAANGVDLSAMPDPETTVTEVHRAIRGR